MHFRDLSKPEKKQDPQQKDYFFISNNYCFEAAVKGCQFF